MSTEKLSDRSPKRLRVDPNYRIELGLRLSECRIKKYGSVHGSQKTCADALGIDKALWSKMESGRTELSSGRIAFLAKFFCVDPGWLLTGTEAPQASQPGAPDVAVPGLKPAPENCPNHAICELVSTLLPLLGGTLAASLASPDARERIGHALHEVQRVLSDLESGGSDKAAG